jgi:hypothetical protein
MRCTGSGVGWRSMLHSKRYRPSHCNQRTLRSGWAAGGELRNLALGDQMPRAIDSPTRREHWPQTSAAEAQLETVSESACSSESHPGNFEEGKRFTRSCEPFPIPCCADGASPTLHTDRLQKSRLKSGQSSHRQRESQFRRCAVFFCSTWAFSVKAGRRPGGNRQPAA